MAIVRDVQMAVSVVSTAVNAIQDNVTSLKVHMVCTDIRSSRSGELSGFAMMFAWAKSPTV